MFPVLFEINIFVIHTYGFFIALAFLCAIFISKREAKIVGEDPEKIGDMIFWVLIAAIIGSRLFYVVIYRDKYFPGNFWDVFKIWEGGLVFYGGFIGAVVVAIWFLNKNKMRIWKAGDIVTPAIPFGHFLGRLGCFSAGCCHGKECTLPWAVVYSHPETLAPTGVPVHPTQLYESFCNLLIFAFIMYYKRYKKFDGQVFWTYVIIYAITRSIIEMFRGDFRGAEILGILSTSQSIACVLFAIAVAMLVILKKRSDNEANSDLKAG